MIHIARYTDWLKIDLSLLRLIVIHVDQDLASCYNQSTNEKAELKAFAQSKALEIDQLVKPF